jgi:hypothetical protein
VGILTFTFTLPKQSKGSGKVKAFLMEAAMKLTMAEKRDLIERVTELVKADVLNRADRDDIFRVCLVACDRELSQIKKQKED